MGRTFTMTIEKLLTLIEPGPMRFYRDANGERIGWHLPSRADESWIETEAPERAAEAPSTLAQRLLAETDYVEFRHWTQAKTPTFEWLEWRESLREVVRGNATDIPPEPERYNAP
jgi:hypothetical protein